MRLSNYMLEADERIKIVVLTSKNEDGSSEDLSKTAGRLKEVCEKKKLECYIVFSENAMISKKDGELTIHNVGDKKGFKIHRNNTVVIARGSVGQLQASLDLMSQLENNGIFCVNNRETMEMCSDKYRTIIALQDIGVRCPRTALVTGEEGLEEAFRRVGGKFPCVLKTIRGSKGIGVFIADSWRGMKSALQTIWKLDEEAELLIQEYIEADHDMRIHVLGDEVIAAMKRFKIKDDFRSNYSLGGKVEALEVDDKQREIAIKASKAVDAVWSGVDMMEADGKNYVIEINSSPGTEGIEKATDKNIVEIVLDYVTDRSHWANIKTTECGFIEKVKVEGIGEFATKMDTGNGAFCVLHADKWKKVGNDIEWENQGKTFSHKLETMKTFIMRGVKSEKIKRPAIRLDITFNGETYKNIHFALSDRSDMTTPILMNRAFIKRARLTINPALTYALSKK